MPTLAPVVALALAVFKNACFRHSTARPTDHSKNILSPFANGPEEKQMLFLNFSNGRLPLGVLLPRVFVPPWTIVSPTLATLAESWDQSKILGLRPY